MKTKVEIEDIQVLWSYAEPSTPAVVSIKDELSLNNVYRLRTVLFELLDLMIPGSSIYVDIRHVEYIASAGVGILSAAMVHAQERDIRFFISTMTPKVRTVFDTLGLSGWFTVRDPVVQEP